MFEGLATQVSLSVLMLIILDILTFYFTRAKLDNSANRYILYLYIKDVQRDLRYVNLILDNI